MSSEIIPMIEPRLWLNPKGTHKKSWNLITETLGDNGRIKEYTDVSYFVFLKAFGYFLFLLLLVTSKKVLQYGMVVSSIL